MTCTPDDLRQVIHSFVGGSDRRYRHVFNRKMIFTEGFKAVADKAGAYWFLDIIATEMAPLYAAAWLEGKVSIGVIKINVTGTRALLTLSLQDNAPPALSKEISFTTFPEGEWTFFMGADEAGEGQYLSTLYLTSEH